MARKEKLYKYKLKSGVKSRGGRLYGATNNLYFKDERANKRQGHAQLIKFSDSDLGPMQINGIFDYSYDRDGVAVVSKIVHAKNELYETTCDFKEPKRLPLDGGITLKDQKSNAFLADGCLFIVGCGDILVYDGVTVKSAYKHPLAYIPTTRVGVRDSLHGFKFEEGESENLFTPRRKNTFIGTSIKRTLNRPSTFLLEGEIDLTKKTVLEVKIRTRTSESEANDTTTDYVGINSEGKEVSTIVTLRYERDFLNEGGHYFLLEPPKNSQGEEIKIKIGEKVYEGIEVPFGVSVSGNEISLGFEVTSPYLDSDNITLEYETKENKGELLKNAEIGTLTNGFFGGASMLVTFGGAELYYTDEKRGLFYLPRKNRILLGGSGKKITSLVGLWDNLFGAFKEDSFYKIRLSADSYEVSSSSDVVGAYSLFSTTRLDSDCLVLGKRGIFGIDDYKSGVNLEGSLSGRAESVSELLNGYTKEEKRDAHALFFGGNYYLFIGNDVLVSSLEKRSGSHEYTFTRWTGIGARVAYADGDGIYFGTKSGEIRRFFDIYYDLYEAELSRELLSLALNNEGESTELLISKEEAEPLKDEDGTLVAELGMHMRLASSSAYKKGELLYLGDDIFLGGALDIFEGDLVSIFDKNSKEIYKGEIEFVDPVSKTIKIDSPFLLNDGEIYTVYKHADKCEYELYCEGEGYFLMRGGKREKIFDVSSLILKSKRPILCEYISEPFSIKEPNERANIVGAYLHVSDKTSGALSFELETRGSLLKRNILIGAPLNFDKLSFDGICLDFPFDKIIPTCFFVRNPDFVSVKISTKTTEPLSISEITLKRR